MPRVTIYKGHEVTTAVSKTSVEIQEKKGGSEFTRTLLKENIVCGWKEC